MDVLKEVESVTSLAPIGPDEPLSLLGHHNWGTRHLRARRLHGFRQATHLPFLD